MDEDVPTTDFAQQDPLSRLIQKSYHIPGKTARTPEPEAQGEVLKKDINPAHQPDE